MKRSLIPLFLCVLAAFSFGIPARAALVDEIAAKQQQIQELQRQIEDYERQIVENRSKATTLQTEIAKLNARINQVQLEIKSLGVSIEQTGLEIQDTQEKITDAEQKILAHKQALGKYVRIVNERDQVTLTSVLLNNDTFSDFFDDVQRVQVTQDKLRVTIQEMRSLRQSLEAYQEDLEDKKTGLEQLKSLQEIERRSLATNKTAKNQLLVATKGQESKFQELVKQSKANLERLRSQITYLQQNGISVEDAVKYAQLAAIGAGIRPAFLLALLEVESRLGMNVGSGNWRDDMYLCYQRLAQYYPSKRQYYLNRAETEKAAFLSITGGLGLDPDVQKVSKEPTYGCGGAMGPAQFIPSTWLGYASQVQQLTGHDLVNPWSTQDAFTAAAIKLANAGATSKDRTGEIAAAKAYIGGSTSCSKAICNSYANTVLRKAAEIEQNL